MYGMQITNDSGVVSLDSEFARLSVLQSGRYVASSNTITIPLSPVVSTQEPPLIFVRPDNNNGVVVVGCSIAGSPGNWTSITITGPVNYAPTGSYFIGGFVASPSSGYGARIWDSTGKLIFDTGTTAAVFTRFFQNWTYETSTTDAQGYYINWYSSPLNYSNGDYLMINNCYMKMVSGDNVGRVCGIRYDFSASKLWFTTTALSNPIAFKLPAFFAKIVA
ncbi:hypothetical protein V2K29_02180 [Pseudomonas alliivorans]|nr:hypothetical protein [Pseudomonas alliivorans]